MTFGWGYDEDFSIAMPVHFAVRARFTNGGDALLLGTRRAAKRWRRKRTIPVNEYREEVRAERWRERADAIDQRLRTISEQAREQSGTGIQTPRHPVILIDGKYLVQGSTAGGLRNAVRITNRLLRLRIERRR